MKGQAVPWPLSLVRLPPGGCGDSTALYVCVWARLTGDGLDLVVNEFGPAQFACQSSTALGNGSRQSPLGAGAYAQLPGLLGPAHGRGGCPPRPDAHPARGAERPLPLPQDHRRLRFHLPDQRAPLPARQRPRPGARAPPGPARRISRGRSPTGRSRTASRPASPPPPPSSRTSRPPPARAGCATCSRPMPIPTCWSSTKWATSPMARMPSSSKSSTTATYITGR